MTAEDTATVDRVETVWWAITLLFATVAGTILTLQTGNQAVAAFIGVTVLALGLVLGRASA